MKQCYERHECGVPMLQMVAHRRLEERRPFRYVRLGQPLRGKAPDHVSRMLCVPHYPWEPKGRKGNLQKVKADPGFRGRRSGIQTGPGIRSVTRPWPHSYEDG